MMADQIDLLDRDSDAERRCVARYNRLREEIRAAIDNPRARGARPAASPIGRPMSSHHFGPTFDSMRTARIRRDF